MLTPSQSRAARGLLDWTQKDLAAATGLSPLSVRAFEKGGRMRPSNLDKLQAVMESAGVIFVDENGEGPGVRLKKVRP
jgi:transcriptional regulator with XRE-family HTH domain